VIDLCECEACVCGRNARADAGGVLTCYDCRRGRHRRAKRDDDVRPPRESIDWDEMHRLAAIIHASVAKENGNRTTLQFTLGY
jgi:hypothetical protein